MQSIGTVQEQETALVTAEVLRGMTITKEALFEKQKNAVLESLMGSMVRIASETGANSYAANLNPQFDPALLAEIKGELEKLGYAVTAEAKSDQQLGNFIQLVVSW